MDETFLPTWTSNPKPPPKRPGRSKSPASAGLEQARLKDLCAEDKARIGELVKKLAIEKSQREELESRFSSEREQQTKQIKKLKKLNKELTEETAQLKEEMAKMMEVLDSYKKLGLSKPNFNPADSALGADCFMKSCLEDTEDFIFKEELSKDKQKATDKAQSSVKGTSTQTVCDKEIQSEESKPTAIKEIKNLRSDLSSLTQSMKSFSNSYNTSLRNSAADKPLQASQLNTQENFTEEDRVKQLMQRVQKSSERAQTFMNYRDENPSYLPKAVQDPVHAQNVPYGSQFASPYPGQPMPSHSQIPANPQQFYGNPNIPHQGIPMNFPPSIPQNVPQGIPHNTGQHIFQTASNSSQNLPFSNQNLPLKTAPNSFQRRNSESRTPLKTFYPKEEVEEVPIVEDQFYNECLFDLVDDLERMDCEQSVSQVKDIDKNVIGMIEEMDKDDLSINELAEDSFEALRARAYKVRQSVKY